MSRIVLLNNMFYIVLLYDELCMQLHVIFQSVAFILLINEV